MSGPATIDVLAGGDIHEAAVAQINALHAEARARLHAAYPRPTPVRHPGAVAAAPARAPRRAGAANPPVRS